MIFGTFPTHETLDSILAHSLKVADGRIRKGTRLNAEHISKLLSYGIKTITVAKLEEGDAHEDEAALQLAIALAGDGIKLGRASTGRVNCYAKTAGLLTIPRERLLAINSISETITASTLAENRWVEAGKMVATIKIIPYAVTQETLELATHVCSPERASSIQPLAADQPISNQLCVHAATSRSAHLVQTTMPNTPSSVLEKTERVTNTRLAKRNVQLSGSSQCLHELEALTQHLQSIVTQNDFDQMQPSSNWILISGASAISDRKDVIPQAIEAAGGTVARCGIPVDPGNLLMLGELAQTTVIGIPGCARSPKHNGLDLFMDRLACNLPITKDWITSLAIGGLMDEIIDRPKPRTQINQTNHTSDTKSDINATNVTALLLAGGESKRFGVENKLLAKRDGKPLITHALSNIISSQVQHIIVVLGCDAQEVEACCRQHLLDESHEYTPTIEYVFNADFASGMGSSLKTGISALIKRNINESPTEPHSALICLADMPCIAPTTINTLVSAMHKANKEASSDINHRHAAAFVPAYNGTTGNPVLLMPQLFDLLLDLSEDLGARQLLKANRDAVHEVPVQDAGILIDCDTPERLHQSDKDSK